MKTAIWIFLFLVLQYWNPLAYGATIESERATRASLSESIESIFNGSAGVSSSSQSPEDLFASTTILELEDNASTMKSASNVLEELLAEALGAGSSTASPALTSSTNLPGNYEKIYSSTRNPEIVTTPSSEAATTASPVTIAPETPKPSEFQQPPKETVQIIRYPSNVLANPSSVGSIGGVISEALKLAQVSIAVFGSSLLGTLIGGQTYVISNTTRLVGVGE